MKTTPLAQEHRRAKARLVNMVVHEVSLVDRPANERPFLVVKADAMKKKKTDTTAAPPAAPAAPATSAPASPERKQDDSQTDQAKADLVLPPELKQALVDALSTCIENVTALGQMVADAQTEDGAPVPPNLGELLRAAAAELVAVADQYAAPPPPTGDPAGAETEMAKPPPAAAAGAENVQLSDQTIAAIEQAFDRVIERRLNEAQAKAAAAGDGSTPTTKSLVERKLDELGVLVKAIGAREVLGQLTQGRASSNGQSVEKTFDPPPTSQQPAKVKWDLESIGQPPAGSR